MAAAGGSRRPRTNSSATYDIVVRQHNDVIITIEWRLDTSRLQMDSRNLDLSPPSVARAEGQAGVHAVLALTFRWEPARSGGCPARAVSRRPNGLRVAMTEAVRRPRGEDRLCPSPLYAISGREPRQVRSVFLRNPRRPWLRRARRERIARRGRRWKGRCRGRRPPAPGSGRRRSAARPAWP